jgi:23S rRNA pseudouridine955/2504/2580 synthase
LQAKVKTPVKTAARTPEKAADKTHAPNDAPKVVMLTIDDSHAGQRIDNFLLAHLKGVPKSHVYRILRSGEVRVNKGRIDQTYKLAIGDVVRVPPVRVADSSKLEKSNQGADFQPKVPESARQSLRFIYEDESLLAIDKPAGMAVHGGSGISMGVIETLRALRPDAKFLELVHRLDRETSGVLLIAKKRAALVGMHAVLRGDVSGPEGRIEKHYNALVAGEWPDAIGKKRSVKIKLSKYVTQSGERRVTADEEDGQESHTVFMAVSMHGTDASMRAALLDCDIRTGRTHQIRVHLASIGFPILGDDKYGDFALNKKIAAAKNGGLKRMFLHAHSLAFTHPITHERITIEAPLPKALSGFVQFLDRAAE